LLLPRPTGREGQRMRRTTAPLFSIILAAIAAALATSILIVVLFAASLEPAHAAFPGEDGKIAFQSDRDGGFFEIYRMSSRGTSQTRLTFNSADDVRPSWQPLP
jgi:hypothetical protein